MKLLGAFIAHEFRIQSRSLRSRFVVVAFLACALAVPIRAALLAGETASLLAAGIQALLVDMTLPLLTFLAAAALSLDGITRERDEGSLAVLGLAPISNAGYILRRWLATCVPCIMLSAVPPLVALGVAASWAGSAVDAGAFLWPWLVRTAPSAVLGCAIGLAFGTFAGGVILAVVEGLLVGASILTFGNGLLAMVGRVIDGPAEWLNLHAAAGAAFWLSSGGSLGVLDGSDAPVDVLGLLDEALARITFLGILASATLGLSIAFLRRSQPDVRPWRIRPDHPFRGFLGWLNRIRLSALPDPGLTRADVLAICACFALAGGFVVHHVVRFDRYRALGAERHRVERSGKPDPTPLALATTSWSAAGRLARDGDYTGRFEIVLANDGDEPQDRLACALAVGIDLLEIRADDRDATATRSWDRVEIRLAPGVPPGSTLILRGVVAGRAVEHEFPSIRVARSFVQYWEEVSAAGVASNRVDFSRSTTRRDASPSAIDLAAAAIAPVPRYETWQLQTIGEGWYARLGVPDDDVAPITVATLDIELADGIFLADTCGHVPAPGDPDGRRLAGTCRTTLANLALRGGRFVETPGVPRSIAAVAVLPGHVESMQLHLPQIERAGEYAATAWPGVAVPRAVVVEIPSAAPSESFGYYSGMGSSRSDGSMLLIDERRVLARKPLDTTDLATDAVATALLARRPTPSGETRFFRRFYRALAASRLGTGADRAAMHADNGFPPGRFAIHLLTARSWQPTAWEARLPALVRDLRVRIGDERLAAGVNAFLAGSGAGSARDLFAAIEQEASISLEQFYEDFVAGAAVPVLTLEDVIFTQVASGWRIDGFVRNTGDGHAICPVVARTDATPATASVEVGPDGRTAFALETRDRPRLVLLDPLGDCFRYRPKNGIGIVERVEHGGRN